MKTSRINSVLVIFVLVMTLLAFSHGLLVKWAEAQQPKPGGIIRLGASAPPRQLDPAKQKQGEEYLVSEMIFDSLTTIDHEMRVWPALATSWEPSKDMKTWTFHLRQGVRFHHGRELTAEDVIATLQRIKDPATGSPMRTKLAVIERMEALDKYTVRFYLAFPYGQLHHIFVRHVSIVPKDKIDTLSTHPIGSGPFKFKEYIMGDRLIVVKNPEYWEKDRYHVDGVELRIIPEPAVSMTSLERGELDAYYDVPKESIATLKERKNINLSNTFGGSWDAIAMRNDQPPFNDLRVRQALFYCTNKEELVKAALAGYGEPSHSSIPPGHPMFNKSLKFLKQDFKKAKKLLAEAGYPNGMEMTLYIPTGRATREHLGVAFAEMVKPAGFNFKLQRVPWDKFIADIEGKATFFVTGWNGRFPIDEQTHPYFHSKGSWNANTWHWSNKRVDELLDRARETFSDEERKKCYDEFQQILRDEGPAVLPYSGSVAVACRNYVKNFKVHPVMWMTLKDVWMEK